MIRTVIVGFGNIGACVLEALLESPDFNLIGIVETNKELIKVKTDVSIQDDISKFNDVHVAILCTPSRIIPELAESILSKGINTVDAMTYILRYLI